MPQAYPPESLVAVPEVRTFPILQSYGAPSRIFTDAAKYGVQAVVRALPWDMIAPHAERAMKNHQQTLERLAERGGLSACEAVAVLDDRPWTRMPDGQDYKILLDRFLAWHVIKGAPTPAVNKLTFEEGSTAFVNQRQRSDNPYLNGVDVMRRNSWWSGWDSTSKRLGR
jgi:hypothetical protein